MRIVFGGVFFAKYIFLWVLVVYSKANDENWDITAHDTHRPTAPTAPTTVPTTLPTLPTSATALANSSKLRDRIEIIQLFPQ